MILFVSVCTWLGSIFYFWQEPDLADGLDEGKRASLLMMNFSPNEVEFAIDKLGRLKFMEILLCAKFFELYWLFILKRNMRYTTEAHSLVDSSVLMTNVKFRHTYH